MCDKDFLDANVILCKKCNHEVKLYHNPKVGVRMDCKGAPAIVFRDENPSPEFRWWVSKVCKNRRCKNFNKLFVDLLKWEEFKSLNPPCCPACKQKMKPEKTNTFYFYKCEICKKIIRLANLCDLLPDSIE
ncbi:MAG: hypothetical protein A2Y10_15365 [Planctomycetes bacterium GWF2_41_51]|nr:MAG: hypothetical protein A2Y10_15365 [Planctomycetes bacterium GWF2_41_51]HBG26980.1 hypothetical protein [Phycisphaerales bacterium]